MSQTRTRTKHHRPLHRSRGLVMIAVLIAVGLLTIMMSVTMQGALRSRREVRSQLMLTQANLLCEAGLRRAYLAVLKNDKYSGEEWHPDVSELEVVGATVHLKVEMRENQKWILAVTEILIRDSRHERVQRSMERTITLPATATDPLDNTETKIQNEI